MHQKEKKEGKRPSSSYLCSIARDRTRSDRSTLLPFDQTDILPQRHVLGIRVPQHPANLRAAQTLDPHDFRRGIIHQRPADLHRHVRRDPVRSDAVLVSRRRARGCVSFHHDEPDGLLLREVALDVDDAGGEEAGFGGEGAVGALVDVEGAVGGEAVQEPEGAVADRQGVWEEAGVERWDWEGVDVQRGHGT